MTRPTGQFMRPRYPLHNAARLGNITLVREALAQNPDLERRDNEGLTPLHYAILSGRPEVVGLLVRSGSDVDALTSDGYSATLLAASDNTKANMIMTLYAYDADFDQADKEGNTPLMVAVMYENYDCVALLISKGADVNAVDAFGTTALMKSVLVDNMEISKLLIVHGADTTKIDADSNSALDFAATRPNVVDYARLFSGSGDQTHLLG